MFISKKVQAELTSTNIKFAYHITNIFDQNFITFYIIFYSTWIHIQKKKLSSWILTNNDVSKNVNLEKILKYDLCYKKLSHIKTFSNYLNWFSKDICND
jgi:hypothetical protein